MKKIATIFALSDEDIQQLIAAENNPKVSAEPHDPKTDVAETTADDKTDATETATDTKTDATETTADDKTDATETTADDKTDTTETTADTKSNATETTAENSITNLTIMLKEIINNLEIEHDDYVPAVSAAKYFLITYSNSLASLSTTDNSLDKIKDVIHRIKKFEISRKELLEFLKELNEDIKSTIIANKICALLDSFSNLPLDSLSQELLKLVKSKVPSIRF